MVEDVLAYAQALVVIAVVLVNVRGVVALGAQVSALMLANMLALKLVVQIVQEGFING